MKTGPIQVVEAAGKVSKESSSRRSVSRGLSILDFILRVLAAVGTLTSAIAMGTTKQTLPFVTRFVRFKAVYKDLPTFTVFVIANSIACGYLVLSLTVSFLHIVKYKAINSRIVLIVFDLVVMGVLTGGASAAAAMVNLAHDGNTIANWFPICTQFNSFCQRISGSLIGSFLAIILFMLLIILSSLVISRR
ncbi:casparian strip membrane protein 1-like [Humulus lupulus]|uniref:casparian strip membrane protein 1-like n=1 Tax=Humulus lupulus TaxID=3486 RepID=UPI002B414629|nr:casparian strip membrane protein 1-like [Humulus lupulus]